MPSGLHIKPQQNNKELAADFQEGPVERHQFPRVVLGKGCQPAVTEQMAR